MTTATGDHAEDRVTGDHTQANASDPNNLTLGQAVKLIQQASAPRKVSSPPPGTRVQGNYEAKRYVPTLSLDPGNVTALEGYEAHSGYVQCAVHVFSEIHIGLQKLSDAREQVKKDTSKTEANQVLIVAAEAEKLLNRVDRAFKDAHKRLSDGIKLLDTSLSTPMTTAADNSISAELRALCRSMSNKDREKFISDAMKDRDTKVLNAVLGAPAALSGLTKQMQAHHTRTFHEMTNPEIAQRVAVMRKALHLVESRAGLVVKEIEKALGATWETVGKLQRTQGAAAQALLLINSVAQQ